MTHAQNGTILKSSRRRARSPHFRPVRCLSRPCRTPLTTNCMMILAAMTPPHFQKKPPRRAPIEGSARRHVRQSCSRGHSLPRVLSDSQSLNLFHQDGSMCYTCLYFSAVIYFISSLDYPRDNSCRMLRKQHVQDKLP
jgi:hypothetical protein